MRSKLLAFWALVSLAFFTTTGAFPAATTSSACPPSLREALLANRAARAARFEPDLEALQTLGPDEQENVLDRPAVRLKQKAKDGFVLQVIPVEQAGHIVESWKSIWESRPLARQGDLRTFLVAFGLDVGRATGFAVKDAKTMKVPNGARLNKGFEALNAELPEGQKIIQTYYAPEQLPKTKGSNEHSLFLDELADHPGEIRLPYEDRYPLVVHDASYHLASIAIPNAVWEHAIHVCQAMKAMRVFLKAKLRSMGLRPQEANHLIQAMDESIARDIDTGNGNFSPALRKNDVIGMVANGLRRLSFEGLSPQEVLQARFEKMVPFASRILDEFNASYTDPTYRQRLSMTPDEFINAVHNRVQLIRAAAKRLPPAAH